MSSDPPAIEITECFKEPLIIDPVDRKNRRSRINLKTAMTGLNISPSAFPTQYVRYRAMLIKEHILPCIMVVQVDYTIVSGHSGH